MGIADDISVKRQLLSAFRMRFAPEVQQAKEAVLDSVVEHVLFAAADVGATIDRRLRVFKRRLGSNPRCMS